jgi:hypothetical protein
MNEHDQPLERYIPVTVDELIADLLHQQQGGLDEANKAMFAQFCQFVNTLFNHQSIDILSRFKANYLPFNPDRDTISNRRFSADEYRHIKQALLEDLDSVLNQANFEVLDESRVHEAMNKTSPYGVEVSVDLNEFEDMVLFYRGVRIKKQQARSWRHGFKKVKIEVPVYQRLFVLLKPKLLDEQVKELCTKKGMNQHKAVKIVQKKLAKLTPDEEGRHIFIKMFRDIPFHDLEMLFPNTKIKMRLLDKIKIGVTGGGGTVGGVIALITKFTLAMSLSAKLAAIAGFIGLLWRQLKNIFYHREKYQSRLSQNLYFYNIDNNLGALTYLVNMAQSEEIKETILSYYFLLVADPQTRPQLDHRIESYIQQQYGYAMDFEIDDGLRKLQQLGIIQPDQGQAIEYLPLSESVATLKQQLSQQLGLN